ncbi:outer membrane protein assembly factor BamC [Candidatus Bipolaricaulota bacterium]|nr:outer membrane protein assembly factor BamC [Candidatus Bipolaricaulota bacterium]
MDEITAIIGAVLVVGLIFGAISAVSPSKAERRAWQTETFSASKQKIIQASVQYLQNQGYPIATINENAGFVSTDYASSEQLHGIATGMLMEALTGEKRFKATITVNPISGGQNRVTVKLIAEGRQMFHWSSQSATYYGRESYEKFFSGLREEVRQIR